jgi:hypothetical protein
MPKKIWGRLKNNFTYKSEIEFLKLEGSDGAETEEILHDHSETCLSMEGED